MNVSHSFVGVKLFCLCLAASVKFATISHWLSQLEWIKIVHFGKNRSTMGILASAATIQIGVQHSRRSAATERKVNHNIERSSHYSFLFKDWNASPYTPVFVHIWHTHTHGWTPTKRVHSTEKSTRLALNANDIHCFPLSFVYSWKLETQSWRCGMIFNSDFMYVCTAMLDNHVNSSHIKRMIFIERYHLFVYATCVLIHTHICMYISHMICCICSLRFKWLMTERKKNSLIVFFMWITTMALSMNSRKAPHPQFYLFYLSFSCDLEDIPLLTTQKQWFQPEPSMKQKHWKQRITNNNNNNWNLITY